VIIIIAQIFPFFGIKSPSGGVLSTLSALHQIPIQMNYLSVGIALLTILFIYLIPRITKKIPATLVALIVVSGLAFYFLPDKSFFKINSEGPIPTGLPQLQLGFMTVFSDYKQMIVILEYALTLAALGSIDSLLTSVVADNMTKTRHNSNKELMGQGIGNMASALVGGLPGAGATMRTVINIKSGGRMRLSGVVAGLLLLAVLLGMGSLVGQIPNAVLAGILITVGIGIIDYKGIKHLRKIPLSDAVVLILVLLLTVFVDLLVAVGVGMVLATLLFMKNITKIIEDRSNVAPLKDFSPEITWDDEKEIVKHLGDRVMIKHLDGPLFFGFASGFRDMIQSLNKIKAVVVRMDKVPYVDQSGLYAMEEFIQSIREQGVEVVFTDLHGQPADMFRKIKLVPELVPEDHCFESIRQCATWLEDAFLDGQPGPSGEK
jgi:SulP family sulfate permease